jgi:hypothetical protein
MGITNELLSMPSLLKFELVLASNKVTIYEFSILVMADILDRAWRYQK